MTRLLIYLAIFVFFMILFGSCSNDEIEENAPKVKTFESFYTFNGYTYTTNKITASNNFFVIGGVPGYSIQFDTIYKGVLDNSDFRLCITQYNYDSSKINVCDINNPYNISYINITDLTDTSISGTFSGVYFLDSAQIGKDTSYHLTGNFTGLKYE